jgi:translation initiation factor 2-alpha kinase 4
MYDDDFLTLTPEQLVNACRREGILYLIIVKPSAAGGRAVDESEKSLKVKSVLRGYEEEGASPCSLFLPSFAHSLFTFPVPRPELSTWLIKELREQSIVDEAAGGVHPEHHHSNVEQPTAIPDPSRPPMELIPIIADDDVRQKGRHNKRTMIAHRGALLFPSFPFPL